MQALDELIVFSIFIEIFIKLLNLHGFGHDYLSLTEVA